MSTWAIITVTVLYAYTGLEQYLQGHTGWAGVWVSYASANMFLLMAMKGS